MILPARYYFVLLIVVGCLLPVGAGAQDSLPEFTVKNIGSNRYVISWTNPYAYTAQITIQRSFDSLGGFKSILSIPDPNAKQNGYADSKAVNDHMFYRLYILLSHGEYFFTKAKKPVRDVIPVSDNPASVSSAASSAPGAIQAKSKTGVPDSLGHRTMPATTVLPRSIEGSSRGIDSGSLKNVKAMAADSSTTFLDNKNGKDSLSQSKSTTLPIDQLIKAAPVVIRLERIHTGDSVKTPVEVILQGEPNAYAPSLFVYAHPDGNIRIQVPNRSKLARYRIKFYEPDRSFLFELKNLPAPYFQLDKTNFLHSGWFHFELYEDNRLLEKHKLYLE